MIKLTSKSGNQGPLHLGSIKEKGEVKKGLIIMIEVDSKANIGQTVDTDSQGHLIEVDLNISKISAE